MKKINRSNDALKGITRRRFIQYGSLAAATSIVAACTPTTTTPTTTGGTTTAASPAADGKKGIKVGVMYSTTGTIAIVEKSLQDAKLNQAVCMPVFKFDGSLNSVVAWYF